MVFSLRAALTFAFAQDHFAQFPILVLPNDSIHMCLYLCAVFGDFPFSPLEVAH